MYNIVASDMDGTLLNEEHLLTDHTMQTLKKLVTEKGVTLVLATGRNYYDVRIVFNKLRDYFLNSEHNDINKESSYTHVKDDCTPCVNNQEHDSNNRHKEEHEQEKKISTADKETSLKDCVYLITSNGAVIHDALTQQVVYTKYINPTIAERLYRLYEDTDKNEKCESCECRDNKEVSKVIVNTHCYQNDEWYCTMDWKWLLAFHTMSGMKYTLCPHPPPPSPSPSLLSTRDCDYHVNNNNNNTHARVDDNKVSPEHSGNSTKSSANQQDNITNGFFGNISKIFYIVEESKDVSDVLQRIEQVCAKDDIHITQSEARCLDILASGVNKGSGLHHLFEYIYYKERQEQRQAQQNAYNNNEESDVAKQKFVQEMLSKTIAFGDEANDAEMLQSVGKGCVMGNASTRLREYCPSLEVVKRNSEEGVTTKLIEVFNL